MKPGWINTGMIVDGVKQPKGFDIHELRRDPYFLWLRKTIYLFSLNPDHPLTFIHPDGRMIQPGRVFTTDQGSVPMLCQWIVPKDRFLYFYAHDFGYQTGYLWVSFDNGKTWERQYLSRREHDILLDVGVSYDPAPGNIMERSYVWAGVRVGGGQTWKKYRNKENGNG